jgi:hypothetical protein
MRALQHALENGETSGFVEDFDIEVPLVTSTGKRGRVPGPTSSAYARLRRLRGKVKFSVNNIEGLRQDE